MRTGAFITSLGIALLVGCSNAPDKPRMAQSSAASAEPAAMEPVAEATQIIAYYFHGTIRCETCLKIEKQAHESIETRFATQVAFRSVDYDQRENAHFLKDYKLPCPSLVLVRQRGQGTAKLLGDTWKLVENPPKFTEYIEAEVCQFLEAEK